MTRKKSNVKALALAVTCAILAGGYSGLNPVYAAADTLYKEGTGGNVTTTATSNTEITELTVGGVTIGGSGNISGASITLSGASTFSGATTFSGTATFGGQSTFNAGIFANTISEATTGQGVIVGGVKFISNNIDASGAITASSLKLTGTNAVEDVGAAIKQNAGNITNNKNAIQELGTKKANAADVYTKEQSNSTFAGKAYEGKVEALEDKTKNIKVAKDTMIVSDPATYIDGITHAGGVRLADKKVRAEKLVLEEEFADGTSAEATLTREGIVTLNGLSDGSSVIQASNGSEIGGVTFDSGNITGVNNATVGGTLNVDNIKSLDGHNEITVEQMATTRYNTDKISYNATDGTTIAGDVIVNKGADNQVKITDEGIVVGLTSAAINGDGFYAGGHNYNDAKAAIDGINGKIKGADGKFGVDDQGNVTTTGDIKGKDVTVEGKLSANGDAVVGGDLSVTGKANFAKETNFAGGITTDAINEATHDKGVTIDGVLLKDKGISAAGGNFTVDGATGNVKTAGDIEGQNIKANGALKGASLDVTSDAAVGGKLDVTGAATLGSTLEVTGKATLKDELQVNKKATFGDAVGSQTVINGGDITANGKLTAKSATIGTVGITDSGVITGVTSLTTGALTVTGAFTTGGNLTVTGDLSASGAIKGKTISITDGGSIAGVSFATGGNLTATTGTIAGVSFAAGGDVSGVHDLTASGTIQGATLKVNDKNLLDNNGLKAEKAVIDSVVIDDASITSTGANGLDVENVNLNNGAITANSATIGGVNTLDNTGIYVATGSKIQVGVNTKIEDGSIAVSTNTKLTDQALNLNAANKWTAAGGLVADKATVNGVVLGADATQGKATFTDAAGKVTTIAGDTITTGTITAGELLVDSISLGKDPANKNITIGSNGDIKTNGDITVTGADGDTTVIDGAQATFGKDAMNQTIINKGDIAATAKNAADAQQSTLTHNNKGFKVAGKDASGTKASSFGFDTSTGIGTFTGQDNSTTAINGSAITSTNGGATGVLNGSNLTLTNGADKTELTAGGASFTGAAGEKGGKTTTIAGGTITTDTLNVERINLGGEVIDKGAAGVEANSKLYMDAQGNFRAAGGNFKVNGADGAMTNTVGNTTLKTDANGAGMSYDNTAATGGVKSNVSVADGKAEMAVGANAAVTATDGKVEIKGGTQNVTTTNAGTVFENSAHNTPFVTGGAANTVINGNEITTGKLTTDQLVITGSGAAGGAGSIAFGGDGSITSNIKDAATGKEATFKTNADGTFTEAKDGANVTTNTVNAQGNTNKVTDGTNTSTATQTATSIGGVVTNGTVKMRQELTADGMKVSVDGDTANYTQITNKDVSITDPNDAGKRIKLSDLGQLNDLDGELTARDEYKDNKTAVGAINAEAGIRREEVARLDNRIDDVNNRVDKVGAMAAAIASLKSIGYDPQAPSEFSIGLGQYKGETGVAMGFFHYPNKNFMINVSLSTAGGETMGGIGATWRFGHKSPQKLLDEQREAQAKKELAAAEKYQAAAKLAKEAQERAEYAAKLARQAQVSADNAKAAADATQAKHF